jgi:hypothetical protein
MTVRAKGMDFWKLCAELGRVLRNAILGRPDALNCTNHARGRSDQIVYRAKGIYVYTENGHRPLLARIEWMTSQAHVGPDLGASVRFRP